MHTRLLQGEVEACRRTAFLAAFPQVATELMLTGPRGPLPRRPRRRRPADRRPGGQRPACQGDAGLTSRTSAANALRDKYQFSPAQSCVKKPTSAWMSGCNSSFDRIANDWSDRIHCDRSERVGSAITELRFPLSLAQRIGRGTKRCPGFHGLTVPVQEAHRHLAPAALAAGWTAGDVGSQRQLPPDPRTPPLR